MAKFFIHRPIFAIVISIIIIILGVIAIISLPVAQYPKITQPTVSVSTSYVGANAQIINQTVAQVIEDKVNGTQGMDYMSSNSSDNGTYSLSVKFELGTNSDMDAVLVQNNVSTASASLPADVRAVGVTTKRSSGDMAYLFAMYSPNSTFNRIFISNYANIYILDKLKRIKGVGVMAFTMPALPGLGMVSGWSMELQDMVGYSDIELEELANKIIAAANQRPELRGVSTNGRAMQTDNDFTNGLTVSIPIYQGGKMYNQRRQSKYALN